MQQVLILAAFLGSFVTTSYRSVPNQTDDSPYITSIGERVNCHGVAVSQDLLASGKVKYGDWLYIEGIGLKCVNDTMNKRFKNRIDIWVGSLEEEREFHRKNGIKKMNVHKVIIEEMK